MMVMLKIRISIDYVKKMFSNATEFNSHVTRICSLIQRSIHQSQLLTRNQGGVRCVVSTPATLAHDAAFVNGLVTTGKLVITTRVGSNGITTIMLYFKQPFNEAFEALMTLRASIGRF